MKRTENLNSASERLKEAQQLLLLAIEKGSISSIDRDLVLEKLRKAYDSILFESETAKMVITAQPVVEPIKVKVEKVHEIPSKPKMPEIKSQALHDSVQAQPKEDKQVKVKPVEKKSIFESVKQSQEELKSEDLIEEELPEVIEESKTHSILETQQSESIAEKFQGKRKFMTDSLSNQMQTKPIAAKLQDKPIKDITKEIGVHDKFMFIKELFNGDNQLYDSTLIKVNQFDDIAEALIYIQENFNWNEHNKAANKFIDLIRRKLLNE